MGNLRVAAVVVDGVESRPVGEELVVSTGTRVVTLDERTARIFERIDGTSAACDVAAAAQVSVDEVERTIAELVTIGLVELERLPRTIDRRPGPMARRQMIQKVAVVGAAGVTAPIIGSVVAPSVAAAQTGGSGGPAPTVPGPGGTTTTFDVTGSFSLSGPDSTSLDRAVATLHFVASGGGLTGTWSTGEVPGTYPFPYVLNDVTGTINWSDGSSSVATAAQVDVGVESVQLAVTDLAFTSGPFSSTVSFSSLLGRPLGVEVDDGTEVRYVLTYTTAGGGTTVTLS